MTAKRAFPGAGGRPGSLKRVAGLINTQYLSKTTLNKESSMKALKRITCLCAAAVFVLMLGGLAQAETVKAKLSLATEKGPGAKVGTVIFTDTPQGLAVKTRLKGLPPGKHGFHVHEKPDCGPVEKDGKSVPAMAAGGHYDPAKAGKHLGPDNG
jgi:Cu/Zn superoxide dismutase